MLYESNDLLFGDADPISESFSDTSHLEEAFIADHIAHLPEDMIKEFCKEGGVGDQLVAEGKISRKTIVRLNKSDDLSRRTKMSALLLAKEKNDPLYAKLVKNRAIKRELVSKIVSKYGTKAARVAKQAQNLFLHGKKSALPKNFQKFGGDDRVGDQQA